MLQTARLGEAGTMAFRGAGIRGAVFSILFLAGSGCAQPTGKYGEAVGPAYSSAHLRALDLLEIRPGMPFGQAHRILENRGFALYVPSENSLKAEENDIVRQRRYGLRNQDPRTTPISLSEGVTLSFVLLADGQPIVAEIEHYQPLGEPGRKDIEGQRKSVLAAYGQPSLWQKSDFQSEIGDEIDYVASSYMRSDDRIGQREACSADWQCENLLRKTDCRRLMRSGREPALKIDFTHGGNRRYRKLTDYEIIYDAHERTAKFRTRDLRGAFCVIPAIHGWGSVVTVPE
jgi:hypothetical protein